MLKRLFQFDNYASNLKKSKKQKAIKELSNVHITYMIQKPFPDNADEQQIQALRLCLLDSAVGTSVLLAILLFMDMFYGFLGSVYVYIMLFVAILCIFFLLNWKRCKRHYASLKNGGDNHTD